MRKNRNGATNAPFSSTGIRARWFSRSPATLFSCRIRLADQTRGTRPRDYQTVMLPLLRAAVHALGAGGRAAKHLRSRFRTTAQEVLGVSSEGAEECGSDSSQGVRPAAGGVIRPQVQQAALFEGETFLNAVPISFWPRPEGETAQGGGFSNTLTGWSKRRLLRFPPVC